MPLSKAALDSTRLRGTPSTETTRASTPVTLDPRWRGDALGYQYESNLAQDQGELFLGDETLVIIVGGGEHVPPVDTSVQAPHAVTIREPSIMMPIDRHSGLEVGWDRGDGDLILVTVSPREAMGAEPMPGTAIACTSDDTGSLLVTADLLGQLPGHAGGVIVSVTRVQRRTARVDDATSLVVLATTTGGTLANFMP